MRLHEYGWLYVFYKKQLKRRKSIRVCGICENFVSLKFNFERNVIIIIAKKAVQQMLHSSQQQPTCNSSSDYFLLLRRT